LTLKKTVWAYEAQPKTSAQIVKILTMSGTPLIQFQNNATNKNVLFMKYYRDDFLKYKKGGEVEKANMGMLMAADKLKGIAPKSFDSIDTKIANKVSKKSFAERMGQTGNEEFDKDDYQANTEFAKGGSLKDLRYIPQYDILNVKLKNGKVIENSYNNPIYSGLRIGEAINEQEEMETMGQMRLFKQGGLMPQYATYISARDIDTVYFGDEDDPQEVRGSELKNGIWYDNESGARLVEFAKSKGYLK
jgi:hypothetical protein